MSISNEELPQQHQEAPQSYEMKAQLLLHHPVEIDMTQPNRAEDGLFEHITGSRDTKLIAEIKTPKDTIGILHSVHPEYGAYITVIGGSSEEAVFTLTPGVPLDVTDLNAEGIKEKCIILLDNERQHLDISTKNQDPDYILSTRAINSVSPEDEQSDDPYM